MAQNDPNAYILKHNYLKNFDVALSNFEAQYMNKDCLPTEPYSLSLDQIIEYRKEAVLRGYEKYGDSRTNYITHDYIKPLDNVVWRVSMYKQSHNQRFLCDALNFLMYAYWMRSKAVLTTTDGDMFAITLSEALQSDFDIVELMQDWTWYYTEEHDMGYLLIAGLYLIYEIQKPSFADAFYSVETEEKTVIIGVSEVDLKNKS